MPLTNDQQIKDNIRKHKLREIIISFIASREAYYKKQGFKRMDEMEAISRINRYLEVRKGTGIQTHMKMVLLRQQDFETLYPADYEPPENLAQRELMQLTIRQCYKEIKQRNHVTQLKIAS